jgi:pyruvate,water dikinase
MMDTYHYVRGEAEIIEHVQKCWASLWTSRATMTRHFKKIDHNLALIISIVQRMVHSEVAGVMFTAHPVTGSREEMVLEANWGLGESVVSGNSRNDYFVLTKSPLAVKDRTILKKTRITTFDDERGCGRKETVPSAEQMEAPTLTDDQLMELGKIGLRIEEVFGYPQDIEWAYEKGRLYLLQSRNIRTLREGRAGPVSRVFPDGQPPDGARNSARRGGQV